MLLEKEGYKSANNRAFYSMEKSVKALLALKEKDSKSHMGLLKMFHNDYVHETCVFTNEEYAKFQNAGTIRSASDYDDFYVCSKEDCIKTVEDARYYYQKASDLNIVLYLDLLAHSVEDKAYCNRRYRYAHSRVQHWPQKR